jgi:hypothetical protein
MITPIDEQAEFHALPSPIAAERPQLTNRPASRQIKTSAILRTRSLRLTLDDFNMSLAARR